MSSGKTKRGTSGANKRSGFSKVAEDIRVVKSSIDVIRNLTDDAKGDQDIDAALYAAKNAILNYRKNRKNCGKDVEELMENNLNSISTAILGVLDEETAEIYYRELNDVFAEWEDAKDGIFHI